MDRELTGNVLSTGELSGFAQNALRGGGLMPLAVADPKAALAAGHKFVTQGVARPNALFALSELAFKHASEGRGRPYYLASAVYAFAYLFPDGEGERRPPSTRAIAGRSIFTTAPSRERSRRKTARRSNFVRASMNCLSGG